MKRSRPAAFLCLIVYLCTATGLAQASLLGLFHQPPHFQHGHTGDPTDAASEQASSPLHQIKPVFILDMASLLKNDNLQEPIKDRPVFFVISTELVTWPAAIPALRNPSHRDAPLPLFRSDSLMQFNTLSLQV